MPEGVTSWQLRVLREILDELQRLFSVMDQNLQERSGKQDRDKPIHPGEAR